MKSLFRAGVGFLIAAAVLVVWTFMSLNNAASFVDLNRVPGSFEIEADKSGRYFLWDAEKTQFKGELFESSSAFPENTDVAIIGSDGQMLEFVQEDGDSISVGNNRHHNVGYVEVTDPTTFTVNVMVGDGGERLVSMGPGEHMHMLGGLMVRGITAGACLLLGLLFTLIGAIGGMFQKNTNTASFS